MRPDSHISGSIQRLFCVEQDAPVFRKEMTAVYLFYRGKIFTACDLGSLQINRFFKDFFCISLAYIFSSIQDQQILTKPVGLIPAVGDQDRILPNTFEDPGQFHLEFFSQMGVQG